MNINDEINKTNDEMEGIHMAILAAPSHKLPVVSKEKSREFIRTSNEKRITNKHLMECKKSSSLFKKNF